MKQTYDETIDKQIENIKRIQSEGLTQEDDMSLLDLCLKSVILESEIRGNEKD